MVIRESLPGIDLAPLQSVLVDLAPQGRSGLLPALHAAQSEYGYILEAAAAEIGRAWVYRWRTSMG